MMELPATLNILLVVLFLMYVVQVAFAFFTRKKKAYSVTVGSCHVSAPTYDELVRLMKIVLESAENHPELFTTPEEENQP